jgi:hypothetical protein
MVTSSASGSVEDGDPAPSPPGSGMKSFVQALADAPNPEQIHKVALLGLSEPVAAYQAVLKGYFEFSNVLGLWLHGDNGTPENATFPTFAAWAAESIHPEVVRRRAKPDEPDPRPPFEFRRPLRGLYRSAAQFVLGDDDVVARNLAHGAASVYEEVCTVLRAMLQSTLEPEELPPHKQDPHYSPIDWDQLWDLCTARLEQIGKEVNERRHSSDMSEEIDSGAVLVLQAAVRPYFEVLQEGLSEWATGDDPRLRKRRAELILLGNLRFEAYVQTRVQPVLERNLAYVPDAVRAMVWSRLLGQDSLMARVGRRVFEASERTGAVVDEAFEIAATRRLYSAVIGGEELGFGRDLPLPPAANLALRDRQPEGDRKRYGLGYFFPYDLQTVDDAATWSCWHRYDRSAGHGSRTAVDNWLRYGERLNYVANLFRSRQQLSALYDRPRSMRSAIPPSAGGLGRVDNLSDATRERLANVSGGRQ